MIRKSFLLLSLAAIPFAGFAQTQAPASWFKASRAAEGVWTISDNGSDNMYLVEGRQKALLIDTGLGVARLSAFVRTLTTKPVTVVNTHGHPDHAGGNFEFKTVYAHPADFAAIRELGSKESRMRTGRNTGKGTPAPDMIPIDEAAAAPQAELLPVKDGYIFDLGGRRLEVIESPGHTPGEIVLLDAANRELFTGDNSNALVWLFLGNSRPLEVYLQSLKKLQGRAGEFTTIYPGHGTPLPGAFIGEQAACVESILDGSAKSEPYHSFAGDAMVAKYKTASVAYDPRNLRAKK
jgi:glyoxylase-like metal-dependent hydrolase (beta-lactamase superfamily II)